MENQDAQETSKSQTRAPALNGAGCYAFGILFPVLYLAARGKSRFLRFHSFQCLILFGIWIPLYFVHAGKLQPVVGLLWFLCLAAWVTAMVKAGRGKAFHIPGIGILAEWLAARLLA
jgi:uncharacterized membrane protein